MRNDGISWRDGQVPVSDRFDDPYYSAQDGLAESRHVFLAGNDLPTRFGAGFSIAELGFGTGLNFLAAWIAWDQSGARGPMHFTSFEAYPMRAKDMEAALSHWPELAPYAEKLCDAWGRGARDAAFGDVMLSVIEGDARQTLPGWDGHADAWFLDGFSPAKNPEMWGADVLGQVAQKTREGGSFATYTAAGHVRRALASGGFIVERRPGFGHKRHMCVGHK